MKLLLTGGTGFLGRPLWAQLASQGHSVVVLTRGAPGQNAIGRTVTWQPSGATSTTVAWTAEVEEADAVINLAGDNLAGARWTDKRKEVLRQSRILSTRSLVSAIRAARRRPAIFISGSAVGYYGNTGEDVIDESFPPGSDFLATLCVDWEAEAHAAEALGCRVLIVRSGVVLGKDGGALKEMLFPYRLFAGGPLGSGRQYMSWIHRDDWIRLVSWTLETRLAGPLNATAPNPITNREFSQSLGRELHRPSWLPVPRLALRAIVGEMADVALLAGQRVVPRRALEAGFTFKYATIEAALAEAVR